MHVVSFVVRFAGCIMFSTTNFTGSLFFIFNFFLFLGVLLHVFAACIVSEETRMGAEFAGARVIDSCDQLCDYQKSNPSPLE